MNKLLFTLLLIAYPISALHAAQREWTSNVGSTVQAELKSFDGKQVKLLTKDNRSIELHISQLSLRDQQYLDSQKNEIEGNSNIDDPRHMTAAFMGLSAFIIWGLSIIVLLYMAFRTSIIWGLACLFFPITYLLFVITHIKETRYIIYLNILSVFIILGALTIDGTIKL